jgi:hypothetical protein
VKCNKTSCGFYKKKQKDTKEEWRKVSFDDDPALPAVDYRLKGLAPRSYYEVEIKASNDMGDSALTHFIFFTANGM